MRLLLILFLCFTSLPAHGQQQIFVKVHFLYGSKPAKGYSGTEQKWFGGVLGGHAGVEADSGRILSFGPRGKFHWFSQQRNKHSRFMVHDVRDFYACLGGHPDSMKEAVVYIPITAQQKRKFDSIASAYLIQTPYDYAFLGMRCGAAAYDVLSQLGILPAYSHTRTARKIFYPRKLRRRLFKIAQREGWTTTRQQGTDRRIWEKD